MAFVFKNTKNKFFNFLPNSGNPRARETRFSRNNFFQIATPPAFLKIFWWNRCQMKDNTIWHITIEPESRILPRGPRNSSKHQSMQHTLTFQGFPARMMRNLQLSLHYYAHERSIFHLQLVPSKNVERRRQNSASKKIIFVKKFFFAIGDSPKSGKNGKIIFSIFWRKMPQKHFKTKMGHFGCKMEVWRL